MQCYKCDYENPAIISRELTTLIGVENLWSALAQGVLQRLMQNLESSRFDRRQAGT
jgi:hypothetical protein